MRVLVVLPTYNESENIEAILRAVRSNFGEDGDVLVVDDGSPDGTALIAERIAGEIGGIYILRRPGKEGLGSAYREGFRWGLAKSYDAMMEMDSDFSHDPTSIPSILEPIAAGFDLSIGSRYVPGGSNPGWPWYRWAISRGGNMYADLMLGLGVKDATSGFRAYSTSILGKMDLSKIKAEGYGFQIEMVMTVLNAGGKVTEVPITFTDRETGTSKMSSKIFVEALFLVAWWSVRKYISRGSGGRQSGRSRQSGQRGRRVSASWPA